MKEITISPNQIKNAIEDLLNENEMLQDKVYKLEDIIKEAREYINSNEFIGRIRLSIGNKQAINKLLEILDKVWSDKE